MRVSRKIKNLLPETWMGTRQQQNRIFRRASIMQRTYLICFAENPINNTSHYIGVAYNVNRKVLEHRSGNGSSILNKLVERDGRNSFAVSRLWTGNVKKELSQQKNCPRLCPLCNPKALNHKAISAKPENFQKMLNKIKRKLAA